MTAYNSNRTNESFAQGSMPAPEPPRHSPLQMIWHRRWIVIALVTLGLVCGFVRYLTATRLYTSSAKIVASSRTSHLMNSMPGSAPIDNFKAQCEVITSTAVLLEASSHAKDNPQINSELGGLKPEMKSQIELDALKQNTRATLGKDDGIIVVEFTSRDPKLSQLVLNEIVEAYKRLNDRLKQSSAAEDLIKLVKVQSELQAKRDANQAAQRKIIHDVGDPTIASEQVNAALQKRETLAKDLQDATRDALSAQLNYETKARSMFSDPAQLQLLIGTRSFRGAQISLVADEKQLTDSIYLAQQKLAEFKQRYLAQHPSVQSAQQEVDALNAAYVLFLYDKWQNAKSWQLATQKEYDDAGSDAQTINDKRMEYARLKDDIDNDRKLMDVAATQIETVKVDENAAGLNLQIIEYPNIPAQPSQPQEAVVLFEGLLIGLIVGIAATFMDTRLRSVEEVSSAVGLPILSVIPHMPKRQTPATRGRKVHLEPMSDVAEAFRGLRSAVLFGPRAKTILVTSAMRAEGKSTCAANLAIALAEAGHRILLLDADLREPTQHKIFACGDGIGLSSVVAGRTPAERAIHTTPVKGLELLPCGQVPFNPSETINNQTFADLLAQLASRYDYVVVDSPPVMPVTDARILGAMCDLTILVLRAEKSSRRAAADSRDGLMGFGANILGVVVNDGPRKRDRYGYYGGYGMHRKGAAVSRIATGLAARQGNGESAAPDNELTISNIRR